MQKWSQKSVVNALAKAQIHTTFKRQNLDSFQKLKAKTSFSPKIKDKIQSHEIVQIWRFLSK